MESPEHIARVRNLIKDTNTFDTSYYNVSSGPFVDGGTTQLNVLSSDGAAVSVTASLNFP